MTKITGEVKINAPKDKVWPIVADLGAIQVFHPGVSKSYYTSEAKEGIGAARVCELLPMGKVEETAVEWQAGERLVLEIEPMEKAPPFKKALGYISLTEGGPQTTVNMTVEYTLKFGPIGSLMDSMMIRSQFEKIVPRVLQGLKHYAETGEEVTPEVFKRISHAPVPA